MSIFATEYPASLDVSKASFAAASLAWIRGITKSGVLNSADAKELYDDDVWLEAPNGETLAIKSFESETMIAFGVRHELPDQQGRTWRTECVYSNFGDAAFLRVRGQCVAVEANATLMSPLKPFFVTQSIEDGWVCPDGALDVSQTPHLLSDEDIDLAVAAVNGEASNFLPCTYVSRGNNNELSVDINSLAKKLSGVSHVIVEPDRAFSFELMERSGRKNPYAGAVGIIAPGGRQIERFFRRFDDKSGRAIFDECVHRANEFVSGLAARRGWEWQQLQEAQSRMLREKVLTNTGDDLDVYIEQFDSEMQAKDEQIANLKELLDIAQHRSTAGQIDGVTLVPRLLAQQIGPELYEGEFSDRLRLFLLKSIEGLGDRLDERTRVFVQEFVQNTEFSGRSATLISQIKVAAKDGKQMPKQLGSVLAGFGFTKSQDGKHTKFEPPKELFGLKTEVLPSTPSDSQRGGKNRGAEIIRHFGLNELK